MALPGPYCASCCSTGFEVGHTDDKKHSALRACPLCNPHKEEIAVPNINPVALAKELVNINLRALGILTKEIVAQRIRKLAGKP